MGYRSITYFFYKMLKFDYVEMQSKMGQFALYSVALTTTVTYVDDLHQAYCY